MLRDPMVAGVSTEILSELYDGVRTATLQPVRMTDAVGLETEAFITAGDGSRIGIEPVSEALEGLGWNRQPAEDPVFLADGAKVSFEPGGQLEVSTDPAAGISEAVDLQLRVWRLVAEAVPGRVVFAGLDVWNDVGRVPLQLKASRYTAMDVYLTRRGPAGRTMMRHTCAVQVNLDGGGPRFSTRLACAQALAPFLTVAFAASPSASTLAGRAAIWRLVDPSRTGFLPGVGDPADALFDKAMSADVLLVRRGGASLPGQPGFTFRRWAEQGHPEWGYPTVEDVRYHLTTLFPEVRPRRGTLELRTPDALPLRFLPALIVLTAAAVYDEVTATQIGKYASGSDLDGLHRVAVERGYGDARLGEMTRRVWRLALEAARTRAGIRPEHLAIAADFVERYVERGVTPADELRTALRKGAVFGLDWAAYREEGDA